MQKTSKWTIIVFLFILCLLPIHWYVNDSERDIQWMALESKLTQEIRANEELNLELKEWQEKIYELKDALESERTVRLNLQKVLNSESNFKLKCRYTTAFNGAWNRS